MNVSLIITTYNRPDALLAVLTSIENQISKPFEVIIADDGSSSETRSVINNYKKNSILNLIHSWQDDQGFRVAKSRNKAIIKSRGEYIILIDGDMILHKSFIQDHINSARNGFFSQGSRVLLSKNITKEILTNIDTKISLFTKGHKNRKNGFHSNTLSKFFSKNSNSLTGIKSCNLAFFKSDCIAINGFNNDFEGWGREDSEFASRLMNYGVTRQNLRFIAIQFHLWHNESSRSLVKKNTLLLKRSIENKIKWCKNGISSI
jgi:glycosyltransferase involved in cell wall biosynthesis